VRINRGQYVQPRLGNGNVSGPLVDGAWGLGDQVFADEPVEQGKFWEYHDQLFAKQSEWSGLANPFAKLVEEATVVGMNSAPFSACLQARSHDDLVKRDVSEGFANDVDRTPTVFINDRRYFAMSSAEWKKNLDAALLAVSSTRP
jgi:protein-disulfide isomerase